MRAADVHVVIKDLHPSKEGMEGKKKTALGPSFFFAWTVPPPRGDVPEAEYFPDTSTLRQRDEAPTNTFA